MFSKYKRKWFLYLIIKHWLILWCQIWDGSWIFTGTDWAIAFNVVAKLPSSSIDFIIWPQGTVGISWWDQGYLCSEGHRVAPGGKVCVLMNKKKIRKIIKKFTAEIQKPVWRITLFAILGHVMANLTLKFGIKTHSTFEHIAAKTVLRNNWNFNFYKSIPLVTKIVYYYFAY